MKHLRSISIAKYLNVIQIPPYFPPSQYFLGKKKKDYGMCHLFKADNNSKKSDKNCRFMLRYKGEYIRIKRTRVVLDISKEC